MSSGGKRILATGSADKTVRLWSVEKETPQPPDFSEELSSTSASATSSTASAALGASHGHSHPQCINVLSGHTGSVTCLYAIDSDTLCSGGNDNIIYLWNVTDGSVIAKIERQEEENLHCLLPISGDRLVTGSNSNFLYVYDINVGKHQVLAYHRESVRCLVSISQSQFASASLDGAIVVWHAQNLTPLKTLTYPEQYLDGTTKAFLYPVHRLVLLSPSYIAAAFGNGFKIFDISGRECILSESNCHEGAVTDLIPLYDCRRLVTCSVNGCIRIWGVESQDPVPALTNTREPKQAALTVSVRRTARAVCFGEMWCHADSVNSLLYLSPNTFASCSHDGTVVLWKDGRVQAQLRLSMSRMWLAMYDREKEAEAREQDGLRESEASKLMITEKMEPPPAGYSTQVENASKPSQPESPAVAVPEYIVDYAMMLKNEKHYTKEQVKECMQEMGHSDSIVRAILRQL